MDELTPGDLDKKVEKWVSDWAETFDQYLYETVIGLVGKRVMIERGDKKVEINVVGYSIDLIRSPLSGRECRRTSLIGDEGVSIPIFGDSAVTTIL